MGRLAAKIARVVTLFSQEQRPFSPIPAGSFWLLLGQVARLTFLSPFSLGIPLVMVGRPSPLEEKYVQKVFSEMEKGRRRTFIKHIPYIEHGPLLADAFAAAHAHALIGFSETPGIASLEAGLNGANVVVSALPPVLEYLGQHAWVVDPHSVKSIGRGLESALNAPRNAKGTDRHVRENFTWERTADRTLEGYRKVLGL